MEPFSLHRATYQQSIQQNQSDTHEPQPPKGNRTSPTNLNCPKTHILLASSFFFSFSLPRYRYLNNNLINVTQGEAHPTNFRVLGLSKGSNMAALFWRVS
ncbi:hypothetical protein RND71_018633 [Anisodus tanguticus]|uniref:Uncharacterized protein n=1 Tax=Anisodus tanguticus TaxID=243964 RepID=A0AAE1S5Z7_9SOLA|nr:hypothetical protein RND71_018633 [Anisodus tanguticus]